MAESRRYQYYYAVIRANGLCTRIEDTTDYYDSEEWPDWISIPEYNRAYLMKYYNRADGKWYTDASFTTLAEGLN